MCRIEINYKYTLKSWRLKSINEIRGVLSNIFLVKPLFDSFYFEYAPPSAITRINFFKYAVEFNRPFPL
jgi:hypothetical protein